MYIHIFVEIILHMRLEDEIKQQSFKNDYQKMVVNLVFTGSWINVNTSEMLKPFKLTTQQYNVLRILRGQYPNPASVNLIIERMLDKMSNASRIVDKLLVKKLADRKVCPDDRRMVDVKITEKGLKILGELDLIEKQWQEKFKTLKLNEVKELNILLDKLRG